MNKLQKINNIGTILQNEDEALTDAVLNVLKSMEVKGNAKTILHRSDYHTITITHYRKSKRVIPNN